MPKKAMDYSQSCIYKICCLDPKIEDAYVGSTTDLVKRRCAHKRTCDTPKQIGYDSYVYKFIRDNGGWENWEVVQIESFPCNSSQELCQREREVFEKIRPSLNTIRPKVTVEERKEANREAVKAWREANPERSREACKAWREANPERHLEAVKAWQEANLEQYRAKQNARRRTRVVCEHCNKEVAQGALRVHHRSKKCLAVQDADL